MAETLAVSLAFAHQWDLFYSESEDDPFETENVDIQRLPEPNDYQIAMMKIINDADRPLATRIPTAVLLVDYDPSLPFKNVWQCSEVLTQALKSGPSISGGTLDSLLTSLNPSPYSN